MTRTLIDAHGSDHGLKVELWDRTLIVTQWAYDCEPDEHGHYNPRLVSVSRGLGLALTEYADTQPDPHGSQRDRIIRAATHMLCLCGSDDIEWLSEDATPAQHFLEDLDAARQRGDFDPDKTQPLDAR